MPRAFVLVGMLDSPFVRRVAIALEHYGIAYEHRSIATMAEEAEFARYSPLKRAPTLVLPNGETLFDSHLILQHLDELAPPERSLLPADEAERFSCRQVTGVATGLADKAVHGVYEKVFHAVEARNQKFLKRIEGQIADSLAWLEARAPTEQFLFGSRLSHADVALGTALGFTREAHPDWLRLDQAPRVRSWIERLDALPLFRQTYLPLDPPTG